jgi:hypothetical protein
MSDTVDFDALLQANLATVFGERDAAKRLVAIRDLYAPEAVLYEPDSVAVGHAEISRAVDVLLSHLPPDFVFTALGPAVGHHGVGRLRWRAGPPQGPAAATGTDFIQVEGGRIQSLHVLLDPPGA